MKTSTLIIVMVVGFLTSSLSAQETIWFDSNWNLTTKENAKYYRIAPKKVEKGYLIIDYYISGKKQMQGLSFTNEPNKEMYIGVVNYYYENEKLFQKVNYVQGKPEGNFIEYYNTGETQRIGKYANGFREGSWKTYYKNGKIQSRGKYKKGEKVGVWKTFYKNI